MDISGIERILIMNSKMKVGPNFNGIITYATIKDFGERGATNLNPKVVYNTKYIWDKPLISNLMKLTGGMISRRSKKPIILPAQDAAEIMPMIGATIGKQIDIKEGQDFVLRSRYSRDYKRMIVTMKPKLPNVNSPVVEFHSELKFW